MNIFELVQLANEYQDSFGDKNFCGLAAAVILQNEFASSVPDTPLENTYAYKVTFEVLSFDPEGEDSNSIDASESAPIYCDVLRIKVSPKVERDGTPRSITLNKIPLQFFKSTIVLAVLKRSGGAKPNLYEPLKFRSKENQERKKEIFDAFQKIFSNESWSYFHDATFVA